MPTYIDCRCPGCRHIRIQAAEGSNVKIKCRQCKLFVLGRVKDGAFRVLSTQNVQPMRATNPPSFRA